MMLEKRRNSPTVKDAYSDGKGKEAERVTRKSRCWLLPLGEGGALVGGAVRSLQAQEVF